MILFLQSFRLFWATLREIFDERAYERHLARTHALVSRESYAQFLQEKEAGPPKPRCC